MPVFFERKGGMPMNEWERLSRQAKAIKQKYPKGTQVCLGHMEGEKDMPSGSCFVLSVWQIPVFPA